MTVSKKWLNDKLRAIYMEQVKKCLEDNGEEVLQTASNEFAIPCVNDNGDDEFIVLTFKVPSGSRDGESYDGYGEAEFYAQKTKEKQEKQEKSKLEKQAKIEKDAKMREQRKLAKEKHCNK